MPPIVAWWSREQQVELLKLFLFLLSDRTHILLVGSLESDYCESLSESDVNNSEILETSKTNHLTEQFEGLSLKEQH